MKKFILITLVAAAAGLWSCSSGSKRFAGFEVGKSFDVNFSFPDLAEEEFGDREKADQAKDWLMYTLMTNSGLKTNDIAHSSFDLAPVRYGFNQAIGNFEYGATRCRYIGEGEVVALVPESNEKERIDNLAHIFDETRKNQGEKPKKAYVFEYDLSVEGRSARLVRLEDVDAADYFKEEKGYYETKANNVDELKSFLENIDDVTYAEKASDGLVFGGRKLQNDKYGNITIEDIAAIWQSEKKIQDNEALLTARRAELTSKRKTGSKPIIQKYQSQLDNLQFEDGTWYKDLMDHRKDEITGFVARLLRDTITDSRFEYLLRLSKMYSDERADKNLLNLIRNFRSELKEFWEERNKEEIEFVKDLKGGRFAHASGFSLDPDINFEASIEFVNKYWYSFEEVLAPGYTVEQLLQQLQNQEPDLMNYAIAKLNWSDADLTCAYQKARYDGKLQGTAVGMTLFYTDLLAKLWAGNRFNSKPLDFIPDFRDHEQAIMAGPAVFRPEASALSAVRLWFGPNKNGFQVNGDRSAINFARNSTQIFALGNDPGAPLDENAKHKLQEKQASAQFDAALSWWNNRYEEVARYEKQYERLNEIMKWSTIISWLNAEYSTSDLSYLNTYSVNHDLWFPDWVKNNKDLKFTAWDSVGFYEKGFLRNPTEAMRLLSTPNKLVIGGVSLAERSLIKESPEILTVEKEIFRRANLTEDLTEPNTFKTFRDTKIGFVEELEGKKVNINLQAKEGYKLRNNFGEVENRSFKWTLAEDANGSYSYNSVLGDVPIGKLTATKTGKNSFAVAFESQSIDKGMSVARQCSDFSGDAATFFKNHPEVIRGIEAENGEWCVQLKNSDEWLVLNIHSKEYAGTVDLPAGYTARTSGTAFDSKIIEMRWVPETEVARLIKRPIPPVEISPDLFAGSPGKFYDELVARFGSDGVNTEVARLRQQGITEAERLAANGEYVKSAMYTEKIIKYLGETDELVAMKVKYDLKAALFMLENRNLVMAKRFVNEAMSMRPQRADFLNEITEMLRVSPIKGEPRRVFTNLVDCYLTDKQIFAEAGWQGYGACSKKVPIDAVTANGNPKIFFTDNGAFDNIDPSTPFETVMAQIRSIPGAEVYDISAVAVGRNTRVYADVEPEMLMGLSFNRLRLRVAPGAFNHCNDDERSKQRKCNDRHTVKGPVYYITAPAPVPTDVN